jgi:hypothetical protein
MNKLFFISLIAAMLLTCCGRQQHEQTTPQFTKADSVTHFYLEFKDSLMDTWNRLIYTDNNRIAAIKNLILELQPVLSDQELLQSLALRADQLLRIRFTPKTIANYDVVEEYDLAASSIIAETIALAESLPDYYSRPDLQKRVGEVLAYDSLLEVLRLQYDSQASRYNTFLELHKDLLKEIDKNAATDKRPLFHLAED